VKFKLLLAAALLCHAAAAQTPAKVVLDAEKWVDQPVRHFYIHGVINGDTAFQLRLPEKTAWKGRLLHFLEGSMGGYEITGQSIGEHAYALSNGAVYVESSQGHRGLAIYRPQHTLQEIAYQASYAVVMYARARCRELYGREPEFSYVYGQSGGGFRATGLIERFPHLYNGAAPIVGAGQTKALLLNYSLYLKYRGALEGQGSVLAKAAGDPFAALPSAESRKALAEILKAGFPLSQIEKVDKLPTGIFILDLLRYKVDTTYLDDYWKSSGYPGADGLRARDIVEYTGEVKSTAAPNARTMTIQAALDRKPGGFLNCYTVRFTSGALAGEVRHVAANLGEALVLSAFGPGLNGAKPGDRFRLDNRDALAVMDYHRYIEGPVPAKLRRPREAMAVLNEAGRPLGKLRGKVIAMFSLDDDAAWPTLGLRYQRQVEQALGRKNAAQRFRLQFIEKAPHSFTIRPPSEISWFEPVHKIMDDLMAWVEKGVEPAPSTRYSLTKLGQIELPRSAMERRGYQAVVTLSVEAKAGTDALFHAAAEDPDNELVKLEMDFDGDGKFDASIDVKGAKVSHSFRHVYVKPGAYLATARAIDANGIQNIAQVRFSVPDR
jgi:hypothetical protein